MDILPTKIAPAEERHIPRRSILLELFYLNSIETRTTLPLEGSEGHSPYFLTQNLFQHFAADFLVFSGVVMCFNFCRRTVYIIVKFYKSEPADDLY